MGFYKDLTGQRFGRLLVIGFSGKQDKGGEAIWTCQCDCGNIVEQPMGRLRSGNTKSCGCLNDDRRRERFTTHGASGTRLYSIWGGIHSRCTYSNRWEYQYYGAKGIRVCEEWNEYPPFRDWALANGYSDDLTIDRIDVNGNYEPSNCRWVSMKEQQNNKSSNHLITIKGETHTLSEWSEMYNIHYVTLLGRLKRGWPEDKLLSPVKKN